MRLVFVLLAFVACSDDPVPFSIDASSVCGDSGPPTFACCRDGHRDAPQCQNDEWTCLNGGWVTCPL